MTPPRSLTERLRARLAKARRRAVSSPVNVLGTVTAVRTADRVSALTFDDGPDPVFTPMLLDVLARHDARATFFLIGARAADHPDIVERIAAEGHDVANHTWDHPSMPMVDSRERRRQIAACARALEPHGCHFFRPPKGHQDLGTRVDVWRAGYRSVAWSRVAEDWLHHESAWYRDVLPEMIAPGRIALLHDALWEPTDPRAADRGPMIEALDRVIAESDFRFVSLTELMRRGPLVQRSWFVRGDEDYTSARTDR